MDEGMQRAESQGAASDASLFRVRWRARLNGALSRSSLLSEIHGVALLVRAILFPRSPARLQWLLTASRRLSTRWLRRLLRQQIAPLLRSPGCHVWAISGAGLERYYGDFADIRDQTLTASLILKAPGGNGEKGVLYCSFEYNWLRVARCPAARELLRRYWLVGASSWSPPDYASFAHLAGLSDHPVFIGISNPADVEAYRLMTPVIEPLPLMACDWIDPDDYSPKPRVQRTIDILMVANWLAFKRHWLLFEALRSMPRHLRVVLVGRNGDGRTEHDIRLEARAFGVRQDLELYTNIDIDEVTRLQCDSRISVLFSAREGSCVAPVESFFADTPVGMMRGCHVGSRAYVNPSTGVLFDRSRLARQLTEFLETADGYRARQWAVENVNCHRSSHVLNETLRNAAIKAGSLWTEDIAPLCWRYIPQLVRAEDEARLAADRAEFADRYGLTIRPYRPRYSAAGRPPPTQ